MTTIERSIVIDRPLAEVFEFVHDPAKDAAWQTTLVESEPETEGPMRVGTRLREVRRFLGLRLELTRELTEYEPPTRSSFRTVSGLVPMTGAYVLEQADSATKLTATGELDAHGVFKLSQPVFARMAGRELEASLGHLRDLLEAGPTSRSPG
jgi:hypothetical protein